MLISFGLHRPIAISLTLNHPSFDGYLYVCGGWKLKGKQKAPQKTPSVHPLQNIIDSSLHVRNVRNVPRRKNVFFHFCHLPQFGCCSCVASSPQSISIFIFLFLLRCTKEEHFSSTLICFWSTWMRGWVEINWEWEILRQTIFFSLAVNVNFSVRQRHSTFHSTNFLPMFFQLEIFPSRGE